MDGGPLKFRDDLVVSRQGEAGKPLFVLKDPVTRKYYRLKAIEYFIASRLDGRASLEEIRAAAAAEMGVELSLAQVERFAGRLESLVLAVPARAGGAGGTLAARRAPRQFRPRDLLFVKLRAVDPDRFFTAIEPWTRPFFSRGFLALAAAAILAAVAITFASWEAYAAQAGSLIAPGHVPTLLLVVIVVTLLHEAAHAATCKHHGGDVREMGFLLIYFMPAFYCNVSDAWLFAEKRKRLWVSFAGPFFQVFVWALATIAWLFVARGTWASEALCLTMAAAGLTTLFNFNPLIKLDGYYLLSDGLDSPNLRGEAFQYVGGLFRRLVGRAPGAPPRSHRPRTYLLYGLTAGAYSAWLVLYVLYRTVGWLASRLQGA